MPKLAAGTVVGDRFGMEAVLSRYEQLIDLVLKQIRAGVGDRMLQRLGAQYGQLGISSPST